MTAIPPGNIFLAKNLLGYRDAISNEHTGAQGGPLRFAVGPLLKSLPQLAGLLIQTCFLKGIDGPTPGGRVAVSSSYGVHRRTSHELHTPLAIIQTTAEVTLTNPRKTEVRKRAWDLALTRSERRGRLIDDLLTVPRALLRINSSRDAASLRGPGASHSRRVSRIVQEFFRIKAHTEIRRIL